jgi:hypothetical protein
MSIFKLIILVMTIPIASIYLSTISIRFILLIFINIVIYYHIIDGMILSSVLLASLEILEGLFQPTLLSLNPLKFLGSFSFIPPIDGPEGKNLIFYINLFPLFKIVFY